MLKSLSGPSRWGSPVKCAVTFFSKGRQKNWKNRHILENVRNLGSGLHSGVKHPTLAWDDLRVVGVHLDERQLESLIAAIGASEEVTGDGAGEGGADSVPADVESVVALGLEGAPIDVE